MLAVYCNISEDANLIGTSFRPIMIFSPLLLRDFVLRFPKPDELGINFKQTVFLLYSISEKV